MTEVIVITVEWQILAFFSHSLTRYHFHSLSLSLTEIVKVTCEKWKFFLNEFISRMCEYTPLYIGQWCVHQIPSEINGRKASKRNFIHSRMYVAIRKLMFNTQKNRAKMIKCTQLIAHKY